MEEEAYATWREKNILARFFTALGYMLISHTEELCYLLMIVDHAYTAAIISLVSCSDFGDFFYEF